MSPAARFRGTRSSIVCVPVAAAVDSGLPSWRTPSRYRSKGYAAGPPSRRPVNAVASAAPEDQRTSTTPLSECRLVPARRAMSSGCLTRFKLSPHLTRRQSVREPETRWCVGARAHHAMACRPSSRNEASRHAEPGPVAGPGRVACRRKGTCPLQLRPQPCGAPLGSSRALRRWPRSPAPDDLHRRDPSGPYRAPPSPSSCQGSTVRRQNRRRRPAQIHLVARTDGEGNQKSTVAAPRRLSEMDEVFASDPLVRVPSEDRPAGPS